MRGWAVVVAAVAALVPGPARGGVCAGEAATQLAFVGVALEGPADPSTGNLLSPARFRVERWIGPAGPGEVEVETGVQAQGELIRAVSVGITPKAGERWRIEGDPAPDGLVRTSICTGSELLGVDADVDEEPAPGPRARDDRPADPGDGRVLSLAVAALGAVGIALALTRRPV